MQHHNHTATVHGTVSLGRDQGATFKGSEQVIQSLTCHVRVTCTHAKLVATVLVHQFNSPRGPALEMLPGQVLGGLHTPPQGPPSPASHSQQSLDMPGTPGERNAF